MGKRQLTMISTITQSLMIHLHPQLNSFIHQHTPKVMLIVTTMSGIYSRTVNAELVQFSFLRDYNTNISNHLEKIQIRIGISGGERITVTHFNGETKALWRRGDI